MLKKSFHGLFASSASQTAAAGSRGAGSPQKETVDVADMNLTF
jgi:hypothetical protein